MRQAQAETAAKQSLRAGVDGPRTGGATRRPGNNSDSDNEISEMSSMQLQMLMDARSKLLQTASDMEKSLSDTDMAIIGNIKQ